MFDKKAFSEILKKIYNSYKNQREFASALDVNRGHLSEYINCKIDAPPKPPLLKKIAVGSKGITTYDELMEICGYKEMIDEYNLLISGDLKYLDLLFEGRDFNDDQKIVEIQKLIERLESYIDSCERQIDRLNADEFYKLISQDRITSLKNDIRITKKKIQGFEKMINQLNKTNI